MACMRCKGEKSVRWQVDPAISIKRLPEEYDVCAACSSKTELAVDYMKHYSACGGCTLDISLPWVQTIASWNIKNGQFCRVWRDLPSKYCDETNLKEGTEVTIMHLWAQPWSKSSSMHDKPLEDKPLVLFVDLEANDARVMYDTTRSIYHTWNGNEEMVIMFPGTVVAKVDKRSRVLLNR